MKVHLPTLLILVTALVVVSGRQARAEAPLGRTVDDFRLRDYRGKDVSLGDFADSKLVVLAFLGTECPLAKLYAGRLERIAQQYGGERLAVVGLDANVQDNVTEIAAFVRRHELSYPVLKDLRNEVADRLGATRTPEVLLLDEERVIRYRGRIDDQHLVGTSRGEPERDDLKSAIEELLAGKDVSVPRTEPHGCLIGRVREVDSSSDVTWSNQISRIVQKHCVSCHREGEVAPFSLTTYDDVVGWGDMIAEVIREQRMPPWHADPQHGRFANDCSLPESEKRLVYRWVERGCPEGDVRDLPEPQHFTEGWQLSGKPDRVIAMADAPHKIPADAGPGGIAYQNFWVDPGFTEETWVKAIEVRPGNRAVVHHVVVYLHPGGKVEDFNGLFTDEENYFLAAYLPGQLGGQPLPDGAAKRIPAGSWFRIEVHYVSIGMPQEDLTSVGMIFADPQAVTHEVRTLAVLNPDIKIQPFEDDQKFSKRSKPTPIDMQMLGFIAHMHLRGQSFRYDAEYPNGDGETLLNIPRFDFNWQTNYVLAEPKKLPAGSRVRIEATFDNSAENLANPDPSATVVQGLQSWDEMMVGYVDVLFPVEESPEFPFGFF